MTARGVVSPGAVQYHSAPNAALLIDFDNVTMAIRSDLGKELKALLNSDVIRGKVAVQRAYADWRRYPQYIVPLAESSVDLIFAPAYGSSKKNATDLRMAIDAMELVFTRPEIGTYILMTGDSDFSSAVLKLKEYGKYVIGVGMRESSSDLLIQNCDEYYSYHSLSGLTREGEAMVSAEDPWVLVKRAVQQMVKNGDVMRTDRLKQVMLELDPSFDEKKLGYSKFSRFVAEAASKDLLRLRRMENGQHEIIPEGEQAARPAARPAEVARPAAIAKAAEAEKPAERDRGVEREKVVERIVAEAEAEASSGRRGRGRGRGRDDRDGRGRPEPPATPPETVAADAAAEAAPPSEETPAREPTPPRTREEPTGDAVVPSGDLDAAYALLQEAVRLLVGRNGKSVRDGDVKRKMLEISAGFDESTLGFSKFTRFLRQAHDAEVIDLSRTGGGNYDVSLPAGGKKLPPPQRGAAPAAKAPAGAATTPADRKPEPVKDEAPSEKAAADEKPAAVAAPRAEAPAKSAPQVGALRGRRGGRAAPEGPPPILPGQVARPAASAAAGDGAGEVTGGAPAEAAAASEAAPAAEEKATRSRGRGGRRGRGRVAASETPAKEGATEAAAAETAPAAGTPEVAAPAAEAKASTARGRRGRRAATDDGPPPILEGQAVSAPVRTEARASEKPAAKEETPAQPTSTTFSAERLGLPTGEAEVRTHLTSYRGIGAKTADALVEKFGASIFEVLQERPAEVRELLGDRRAGALLEQWGPDYAARAAAAEPQEEAPAKKPAKRGGSRKGTTTAKKDATAKETKPKKSGGTSRAKGGRSTTKKEPAGSK